MFALLGLAMLRAARRRGPAGVGGLLASGVIAVLAGTLGVLALSGLLAASAAEDPTYDEGRAMAIYDLDAAVATRPLPVCSQKPARRCDR